MPIWKPIYGSSTICGGFGFLIFQRTRFGGVFRSPRHSARVPTELAFRRMACFAEVSRIWSHRLSDLQRTTWATYARTHPLTIPCRGTRWLAGQQYFARVNVPLCLADDPLHFLPQDGD